MDINHNTNAKYVLSRLALTYKETTLSSYLDFEEDRERSCIDHAGGARAHYLISKFEGVDHGRLIDLHSLSTADAIVKELRIEDLLSLGYAAYELLATTNQKCPEERELLSESVQHTKETIELYISKGHERERPTAVALWWILKTALRY